MQEKQGKVAKQAANGEEFISAIAYQQNLLNTNFGQCE
jgi:hypothetical protein